MLVGQFVKFQVFVPTAGVDGRGRYIENHRLTLYEETTQHTARQLRQARFEQMPVDVCGSGGIDVGDMAASRCSLCYQHVPHCLCAQVFFPQRYRKHLIIV